ncbi:hypothetical protein BZA05DRAFT_464152 [Tricharina praecox]|uniref:uncharacterized protein n=1 Tax=Tricharina praecox TaxID=43433 RepID=UPI00221F6E3F|nr:uncharacterized protein BZA05DRAFT_464152 [Tricharina praecox]KAI5842032.1 hypothetical protein BZA05DRAFT_464152 [Tricharina praecox]
MDHPRIVVGIDFGTTYSSIAWATTSSPTHISLIAAWPSAGARTHHSTPSEISYHVSGSTSSYLWGYDIPSSQQRLKWFKLLLETDDEAARSAVPIPPGMKPTDVARDFLAALYHHAIQTLWRINSANVMRASKVDFVVTVPAVWTDAAKNRTRLAAEQAGIAGEHELQLLSEPEAAAIYSIKIQESAAIRVGDRIVVCDAGGGTVDLVSYSITSLHPVLRVSECCIGDGDFCGSTQIDRNFEQLLAYRMGAHYTRLRPEVRNRIVRNFEEVKCAFEDRPEKERFFVQIPTLDTVDEPGVRIRDGEFEITRQELRGLFDPVVNKIIQLVASQVELSCAGNRFRVNYLLLVGGFGESRYLYKRLQAWASIQGIETLQPRDAATAVVKGAVIRGLDVAMGAPSGSVVRLSRRNYGTPMSTPFIDGRHSETDAYLDPFTGAKMAKNQISWFIRRGDPLSDDTRVVRAFTRTFRKYQGPWVDTMVACELDPPPGTVVDDVKTICTIAADLADVKKSKYSRKWRYFRRFYVACYTLDLTVLSGEMRFELVFNGESYGFCRLDFDPVSGDVQVQRSGV